MIVKFKVDDISVTVDDDSGVTCTNKDICELVQGQFDLLLDYDDVSASPAGIIGESMKKAGYEVEFIPTDTIH